MTAGLLFSSLFVGGKTAYFLLDLLLTESDSGFLHVRPHAGGFSAHLSHLSGSLVPVTPRIRSGR